MDAFLRTTLHAVRDGRIGVDEALERLAGWRVESLSFATIDHHREVRTGFPEVVFCAGKTAAQAAAIADRIWRRSGRLLATRADDGHATAILAAIPGARYNRLARTVAAGAPTATAGAPVGVVTAGTSDLPVAEEAVETLRVLGRATIRIDDVGVAGLHRVLDRRPELDRCGAVIVLAGMDGALASVVGGLVRVPVVGVPTSVGYGAAFEGLAPLLSMLNSCAPGVVVVNIDNGFGAALAAARIVAGTVAATTTEAVEGACA